MLPSGACRTLEKASLKDFPGLLQVLSSELG